MQFDKWTTEGAVKSTKFESIPQRTICVMMRNVMAFCVRVWGAFSIKQGGTAGF
jgi:hypothetical protein